MNYTAEQGTAPVVAWGLRGAHILQLCRIFKKAMRFA